ncbi:MAG: restriction endonuclease subunit S, partial [Hyphomicrobiaceae bacterium]|nr:restriction endonuclease subunit S [Hyphomicrobiaceae bacterium]
MNNYKSDLPPGWTKIKLEHCVEILDNQRIPINASERSKRIGDIPYYGSTGQVGWIDDYLFNEELVLLGEDGAPFLDNSKNKAYIISGKSWVNNHAHVLKACKNLLNNIFLCHFLNQIDYQDYVTGTTRMKLNQARMKTIEIFLCPLPEQLRIVDKIESIFGQIDAAIEIFES